MCSGVSRTVRYLRLSKTNRADKMPPHISRRLKDARVTDRANGIVVHHGRRLKDTPAQYTSHAKV